jgi:hypothetical protein
MILSPCVFDYISKNELDNIYLHEQLHYGKEYLLVISEMKLQTLKQDESFVIITCHFLSDGILNIFVIRRIQFRLFLLN